MVSMASQRVMNHIESFSINPRKRNTKQNVPAIGISTTHLLLFSDTSSPTTSGALKESKELMTKIRTAQPPIQHHWASLGWLETRFEGGLRLDVKRSWKSVSKQMFKLLGKSKDFSSYHSHSLVCLVFFTHQIYMWSPSDPVRNVKQKSRTQRARVNTSMLRKCSGEGWMIGLMWSTRYSRF